MRGDACCQHSLQCCRLTLSPCLTFWSRLRGLHGHAMLTGSQGLLLAPCRAVHTLGMGYPVDVVFLDAGLEQVRRVDSLKPNRFVVCGKARMVVELPAGYCRRHPGYLRHVHDALACMIVRHS